MSGEPVKPFSTSKIAIGYSLGLAALGLFYYLSRIAEVGADGKMRLSSTGSWVVATGVLIVMGGFVLYLMVVYRLHKHLAGLAPRYPITGGQAVGYQFLPLFNLYWMFRWPAEVIEFVNFSKAGASAFKWMPGIILLVVNLGSRYMGPFGPGMSLIAHFGVLNYLCASVNGAAAGTAVRAETYERPGVGDSAANVFLWFFIIMVLLVLAFFIVIGFVQLLGGSRPRGV